MARLHSLLCSLLTLAFLPQQQHQTGVQAQYVQGQTSGMVPNPNTGVGQPQFISVPLWRPTTADAYQRVIDIAPELVVLEYNCFYMRDICKNAQNWFNTPRGQSRRPQFRFAYDFNSGKGSNTRKTKRRNASCRNFKNRVTCPHSDQGIVMRHDGPWRYKDLEPGTTINEIRADVWPNGQRRPSEVRYTCDEFPPATWMEGGSGSPSPESAPTDAETRCAAFRCDKTRGVKAEQNWQATAHNALQSSLKRVIRNRNANTPPEFPWYRAKSSVAFFEFRYNPIVTFGNGVAAKVYTYATRGQNPPAVEKQISQAKRDLLRERNGTSDDPLLPEELDREAFWRWADAVTVEELLALGPAHVSEQHILANHTEAAMHMPDGLGMSWMDFFGSGEDDEDNENDDESDDYEAPPLPDIISGPPRAEPNKAKRADNTTSSTPLLKDASATDLEQARKIVEDALAKSAELNAARLASPARNNYRLKPGTVLGGAISQRRGLVSRADNGSHVEAPPPLLDITDEIAAAAALVSEADAAAAGGSAGNSSTAHSHRRQAGAAGSGTYWMEHLTRMGTVPFGDDPSYKVFRNVLDYGAKGDGTTVSCICVGSLFCFEPQLTSCRTTPRPSSWP